jgi:hypothetical protein
MREHSAGPLTVFATLLLGLQICSVNARAKAIVGLLSAAGGDVQVDKVAGLRGTNLKEGDVISTGSKSGAVISFWSGTKVTVAERTEVALPYDSANTRLELRQGAVVVQTASGQVSVVNTQFATSVTLQSVDGFPALCRVAAIGSEVGVLNDKGRVEIHGAGAPMLVPPGKYVVLRAGAPQGGLQAAGKVIAAIPTEVVERQGAAAVPLNLNDPVYWQDMVKTEMNGRVRIELTGGSVVNIGARSEMRIIKHDTATEQTELEMTVGNLRGQVVKLTKPGAHFQVKTQTAVIGVVGTDFIVIATPTATTIICLEGSVTIANVLTSIVGSVTLQAGQSTTVPVNGPPSAAVNVSPNALHSAMNQSGVQTVQHVGPWQGALTVGNVAVSGATIGVVGVTIWRLGNASNLLNQANSNSQGAANGASGVTGAFNNYGNGWGNVGCGINNLPPNPSVSRPYSGPCPLDSGR